MAENHVLLETIELTQSASSVTFDNIPQTGYTDLKIVYSARSNVANGSNTWIDVGISFNGAAINNGITSRVLFGAGTSPGSQSNVLWPAGFSTGSSATASTFSNTEIYIPNYTVSGVAKSFNVDTSSETNATLGINGLVAGLWSGTASITSIGLAGTTGTSPLFVAGSTFSLYGVAAVGTTPTVAPLATGGNIVANDGTYWYHAFLSSGTFTPQKALTCDYLVVAGGAGGGWDGGGGGGAGGLRSTVSATGGGGSLETALSLLSITNYTVTVGAGGAGGVSGNANGAVGSNSVFSTITSTGGGGGGGNNTNGVGGGSGGGAGQGTGLSTGGARTASPVQGFNGGNQDLNNGGGGGGGAGAVGGSAVGTSVPGVGGAGVAISSFASATNTGVSNFYAGGGGGGAWPSGAGGAGGAGGGGAGGTASPNQSGFPATANTGSGGGGNTGGGAGGQTGGNGGSGIVIIRYAMV
jgi:hypothetical protein